MARLLGFQRAQPVALTGVASRGWVAEVTADMGVLGVALSRFATDLLTWGAVSSASSTCRTSCAESPRPCRRRRISRYWNASGAVRRTCRPTTSTRCSASGTPLHQPRGGGQGGRANLATAYTTMRSVLRLFTEVVGRLTFRADRMRAACEREYLGGFALANALTLQEGVPWRRAQVVAGAYIVAAMEAGLSPDKPDADLLRRVAGERGFTLADPDAALGAVRDIDAGLRRPASAGSAHPDATAAVLRDQEGEYERLRAQWDLRAARVSGGLAETDGLLRIGQ
ncbi:hypothetical protein NKH18_39655 [Streptomyces sp. M10(2022)]